MKQKQHYVISISKILGNQDLFIMIACNPKWSGIKYLCHSMWNFFTYLTNLSGCSKLKLVLFFCPFWRMKFFRNSLQKFFWFGSMIWYYQIFKDLMPLLLLKAEVQKTLNLWNSQIFVYYVGNRFVSAWVGSKKIYSQLVWTQKVILTVYE